MAPKFARCSIVATPSKTPSFSSSSRRTTGRNAHRPFAFATFAIALLFAFTGLPTRAQSPATGSAQSVQNAVERNSQQEHSSEDQKRGGARHIPARYMNLITHWYSPWPEVTFDTMRLWDTHTDWSQINTGPGQYDWTALDGWLNAASVHGVGLLLHTWNDSAMGVLGSE